MGHSYFDPRYIPECPCANDDQAHCPQHAEELDILAGGETALDPEDQDWADASRIVDFELGENADYWRARRAQRQAHA